MLKLLFHERAGTDPGTLLRDQAALLTRGELALERGLRSSNAFDRTLVLWRLSVVRAALSFVEALLDQRTVEPVVYRPIGVLASPHADLDGMPLQPIADTDGRSRIDIFEPHRGCLDDLEGFSHVWVLAHLHETTGWDPAVPTFLDDRTHGTFATRSPRRPNAIGLSLTEIVAVEDLAVVVAGSRSPRGHSRPRPQALRPALRRARGRRAGRLVRRSSGAGVRAPLGRPLLPA
jgi:tRNA (Thr-GGU) A37 N-methylase